MDGTENAAGQSIREAVRLLAGELGPTLVAALAGNPDRAMPGRWIEEDGPEPDAAEAERLRFARQQWQRLADAGGTDTARAWFIGTNPSLGDNSPVSAIREGRFQDVERAVTAMINDEFAG
ncbi:hypothetical protein ACFQ36_02480 [Arthrobacter sp. GCM10027362]